MALHVVWTQDNYDLVDQSGPYAGSEQLLDFANSRFLGLNRQPRLVDLRCGTGQLVQQFARANWATTGFDTSPHFTASWAEVCNEFPGCDFRLDGILEGLRSFSTQAELIVAFDDAAIELITNENDLEQLLHHALGALTPGGILAFQLERGTTSTEARLLDIVLAKGFAGCWATSPIAPAIRHSPEMQHRGSRCTFVATKAVA